MRCAERRVGWDVELVRWASDLVGRPFAWGETDCGTLCRQALGVLYGASTVEELLGAPWRGLRSARRAWARLGSVDDLLRRLGAEPTHPTRTRAGDIVVLAGRDGRGLPRLSVVVGGRLLTSSVARGVAPVRLGDVPAGVVAWRLP